MREARKKKDPIKITGSRTQSGEMSAKSGGVWLQFGDVLRLRAFLPLSNFKFNVIAFLKALVAIRLDGAVVDKNIGSVITANKAEALRVVKPFHFTFNSRHVLAPRPRAQ